MPNNGGQRLPSHWPMSVTYLTASTYHSSVPGTLKRFLQGTPTATKSTYTRDQHSAVLIRRILDIDHPAFEQFGLFAGRKIPANTFIIVYKGEIHCDQRVHSDYDLSLHRTSEGLDVGIDAHQMGNEARFINDYRGVRDKPNVIFVDERGERTGELQMTVWSGHHAIRKGEEILVSYGKGWWKARDNTLTEHSGPC